MNESENCGGRADAQGQGQYGSRGEPGRTRELAEGIADVIHERHAGSFDCVRRDLANGSKAFHIDGRGGGL